MSPSEDEFLSPFIFIKTTRFEKYKYSLNLLNKTFKTFSTLKVYIYFKVLIIQKNKNKYFYFWNLKYFYFIYCLFIKKLLILLLVQSLRIVFTGNKIFIVNLVLPEVRRKNYIVEHLN
jgi:hypothetical protein